MKQTPTLAAVSLIMALTLTACVSAPSKDSDQVKLADTPEVLKKAEPVLKERTEEYRVPVLLKETKYFADGLVDTTTEYNWSADFTQLLASITRKPSLAEPAGRIAYQYQDGLLAARTNYGPDGAEQSNSTFFYDKDGQLIREILIDEKQVIQSVSEWVWTEGYKTEWRVLDAKGLILARTTYTYLNGLPIELLISDGAGNSTGRGEYRYDDKGRLLGIQYFSATGTPQDRVEYAIENGLPIQERSFRADGRLERTRFYEFGPEGQVLKMSMADAAGRLRELTDFEYTFRTESRTVSYYE